MAKKKIMVHLVFPPALIKKPIIYTAAKKYNVIPNIRRAKVTETVGEVTLELAGKGSDLERVRNFFERKGVKVEPVLGDIVE